MTSAEVAAMSVIEAASAPGIVMRPASQGPNHRTVRIIAVDAGQTWREFWSWYVPWETASVIADRLEELGRPCEATMMRRAWRHAAGLADG